MDDSNSSEYVFPSLRRWVTEDGWVNYNLLSKSKSGLEAFDSVTTHIQTADVNSMDAKQALCFYMNAYNYIVLDAMRKKCLNDHSFRGNLGFIQRASFFFFTTYVIGGKKMSLYALENNIIRPMKEPRIHFAINCGAFSCPRLSRDPFTPQTVDKQMDALADKFINKDGGVELKENKLYVSAIFKWYSNDFKASGGIAKFIKGYWKGEDFDAGSVKVVAQKYNWVLNDTMLDPAEEVAEEIEEPLTPTESSKSSRSKKSSRSRSARSSKKSARIAADVNEKTKPDDKQIDQDSVPEDDSKITEENLQESPKSPKEVNSSDDA